MKTADFDFDLPPDRIAQAPAQPRSSAKLLTVGAGGFGDWHFADLPRLLKPGDLIVANDSKVIPARLTGRRGAAKIEATLHRRLGPDSWLAFAKPARKLKAGDRIEIAPDFWAEVAEKRAEGEVALRFPVGGAALMAALHRFGTMPLPPYIRRPQGPLPADRDDYQTAFARREGAVAAPTAALHFTPDLIAALAQAGVEIATVTLHVGAGTFLPVKVEAIADHKMHAEYGEIDARTVARIERCRQEGGRILALGTTSLRLLESAADAQGRLRPFAGETEIFIAPGYRFKTVDRLITNFHLPRSTLFMLVAAFAGLARMKSAYAHAIERGYRFYSYGDGSLLEPERPRGDEA